MFTPSTMDVISGYAGSDDKDDDKKIQPKVNTKVVPQTEVVPDNLPKGVVPQIFDDGSVQYHYKGNTYENLEDIRGFLGFPLRTTPSINNLGQTVMSQLAKSDLAMGLLRSAATIGDVAELPGESLFAQAVGDSAQQWGIPYWIGETAGYVAYPGFGEAKAITKSMKTALEASKTLKLQPVGLLAESAHIAQKTDGPLVSNVFKAETLTPIKQTTKRVALKNKFPDNSVFNKQLSERTAEMQTLLKKEGDLKNYKGSRVITAPDGSKYRYRSKGGGVYAWDSQASNAKYILKRIQNQGADTKSIIPHFQEVYGAGKPARQAAEVYVDTNRKVFSEFDKAIKRYNKTVTNKADKLSLEHIFDVDFYSRLKELAPGFAGKGANEMGNIKALSYVLNSKTGALNKKIDIHDALIKTVQEGGGLPSYKKSINNFIKYDIGENIKNFTKQDWDDILKRNIQDSDLTVQDLVIEKILEYKAFPK